MDEAADFLKHQGGLKRGDVLVIPSGTYFSIPVYEGRWEYTFPCEVRVEISYVDYHIYRLWQDNPLSLHSLPKYSTEPGFIVPNWINFKI